MSYIKISHLYKHFYNALDANVTSWSLTFPKFNCGNETNRATADQRREQGIIRPFQAKHNSSSSSKSALENPPPLIQWGTPEYGSLRKNIIDNNTFIQPRTPTKHPLLPRLDHFLQDCSTSLLSKYRGFRSTNFMTDAVSELQSLKERQGAAATQKVNRDVVKYPTTNKMHERRSQFFDKSENRSRMHNLIAPYASPVLNIGEQKQTIDLQYRHNRIENELTMSFESFCPNSLADGLIKKLPLPRNLQKNEYFIRKCANDNMKNVGRSSTTTTSNSGEDDCITSSLDKNDKYQRSGETSSDMNILNRRTIAFMNNKIGVDPHEYGINDNLTSKLLGCSSQNEYDRKSKLAEIDKVFEIFIPTMRTTAISPVFQKDLINLHKNNRLHEIVDADDMDDNTITGNYSTKKQKTPSAEFMLQPNALLSHFKSVSEAFRKFAVMDSTFKDLCPGDQKELLDRNSSLFIMVS